MAGWFRIAARVPCLFVVASSCIAFAFSFTVLEPATGSRTRYCGLGGLGGLTSRATTQLNGIRGFNIWFENEFPDSIVKINAETSEENFDHVLIDMNHMIHVVSRRSRNDEHAVRIIMSALDELLNLVVPSKSLVLAIDGAPPAAKLATQRSRRFGTLVRTEWKLEHFDKLKISKGRRARRRRSYQAEIQSLQITPGTEFQHLMESTLQYWAWQRLQHRHSKLRDVRVFISPSTVPGEGEVKLLSWIMSRHRAGQSVAIVGRDSDLVLEGLIIPPAWTHNVYVIQQLDTGRDYVSVSIWETTRKLMSWLPPQAPPEQILQVRTDLVLLVMLNGNDYLPKLRGSKGFTTLCQTYRRLLKEEFSKFDGKKSKGRLVGLVDPDSLEFRLDFSIRFFEELHKLSPLQYFRPPEDSQSNGEQSLAPMGRLNNILDAGFVPRPMKFHVIKDRDFDQNEGDDDDEEGFDDDDDDEEDAFAEDFQNDIDLDDDEEDIGDVATRYLVQLTLGDPKSDDFLVYETWHIPGSPFKETKHKLARMALNDFFGMDPEASEEDSNSFMATTGFSGRGYSWEISQSAPGKVDTYLGGLLWTIQTYQDGICADYGFSYGRRSSPSLSDIVDFLKEAKMANRSVGRRSLIGTNFTPPVSAGLACLAALPAQVKHLIPEPYRWIPDDIVEQFYATCMDKVDNAFDMKKFEALCHAEIQKINEERGVDTDPDAETEAETSGHGRRIMSGDHWWTVFSRTNSPLAHPFDPPSPPCKKFSELIPNPRVRVSREFALSEPRPRSVWEELHGRESNSHRNEHEEIQHSSLGELISKEKGKLMDIPYKLDFAKERQRGRKLERPTPESPPPDDASIDIAGRLGEFGKVMPPATPVVNKEGQTALGLLTELHILQMIGPVQFNISHPSNSIYAAIDPGRYENFHLRIFPSENQQANVVNRTLSLDQDRDVFRQSKQSVRQHLAGLALSEILGPGKKWTDWTFADLRWFLQSRREGGGNTPEKVNGQKQPEANAALGGISLFNKDGQSAVECLYMLWDIKLIGKIEYSYKADPNVPPSYHERATLVVVPSEDESSLLDQEMSWMEERPLFDEASTRKVIRQRLASQALAELLGPELDWTEAVPFVDFRMTLKDKAREKSSTKGSKSQEP